MIRPQRRTWDANKSRGFTLVEMVIVVAIILTLSALAIPSMLGSLENARVARAVGDMDSLQDEIGVYQESNGGALPDSLADIGRDQLRDPWGNPYQYLNFANVAGRGRMRKDRFLVPINTEYDLYSMGKDGQSVPPITARPSRDDVIRANDGSFMGLASNY